MWKRQNSLYLQITFWAAPLKVHDAGFPFAIVRVFLLKQAHLGEKSESNSRQISNGSHPRMRQTLLVVCELLKFGGEGLVGLKVTPLWV